MDRVRWEITREAAQDSAGGARACPAAAERTHGAQPDRRRLHADLAAQDLPERFVRKGQELGYVVPAGHGDGARARVAGRCRPGSLAHAATCASSSPGRLGRHLPGAGVARGAAGDRPAAQSGAVQPGRRGVALDPAATGRPKTLETWFEFELELPATQAFVTRRACLRALRARRRSRSPGAFTARRGSCS